MCFRGYIICLTYIICVHSSYDETYVLVKESFCELHERLCFKNKSYIN